VTPSCAVVCVLHAVVVIPMAAKDLWPFGDRAADAASYELGTTALRTARFGCG
jgi:hypothetical protein